MSSNISEFFNGTIVSKYSEFIRNDLEISRNNDKDISLGYTIAHIGTSCV